MKSETISFTFAIIFSEIMSGLVYLLNAYLFNWIDQRSYLKDITIQPVILDEMEWNEN